MNFKIFLLSFELSNPGSERFNDFLLMCAETGGILLSPRPASDDSPLKPEFPARPFFGVEPVLLDDKVLQRACFGFALVVLN